MHRTTLYFAAIALSVAGPAVPAAGASLGELKLHATFECIGAIAELRGELGAAEAPSLAFRRLGTTEWLEAHPPVPIRGAGGAYRIAGSVFGLAPDTAYEVRMRLGDGRAGGAERVGTVRTRSEDVPTGGGRTVHVAPDGTEDAAGTQQEPLRRIHQAANQAGPGDTVLVHAGTYHEEVSISRSGSADAYLVLRAEPGAILDGCDDGINEGRAQWRPVEDTQGLFATDLPYETCYVSCGDERLYHWQSLQELIEQPDGIVGGWYRDAQTATLYVILPDGRDPNGVPVQVGQLNCGIAVTDGNHHVLIEGFEIRSFGGGRWGKGIDIRNAAFCIVRANKIVHCPTGILVRGTEGHDTLVEDNECTQHNVHLWPWERVKGTDHENAGISNTEGSGTIIRRNRIQGVFNGIIASTWGDLENEAYNENVDTYDNEIRDIGDDCLEPEGTCVNMRYFRNRMRDCLVGVSLAPITRGPAWVLYNSVLNFGGTWLKVSSDSSGPCFLYHNSALTAQPDHNAMNVSGPWSNMTLMNNILAGTRYVYEDMRSLEGNFWDYNLLYTNRPDGGPIVKWKDVRYQTLDDLREATGFEQHGLFGDPRFVSPGTGDLHLAPDSPAIDKALRLPNINDHFAGDAPDIGALEFEG